MILGHSVRSHFSLSNLNLWSEKIAEKAYVIGPLLGFHVRLVRFQPLLLSWGSEPVDEKFSFFLSLSLTLSVALLSLFLILPSKLKKKRTTLAKLYPRIKFFYSIGRDKKHQVPERKGGIKRRQSNRKVCLN